MRKTLSKPKAAITAVAGKAPFLCYPVNPEAWLARVLERIQDHPDSRINELLPWAYQDMIDEANRGAEAANAA